MFANTTGGDNVALGVSALSGNTTANGNTAIGHRALLVSTTAACNVAIGRDALKAVTTSNNNVAVGRQAGDNITTGAQNILLGTLAHVNGATDNYSIVIGYDAAGKGGQTGFIAPLTGGVYQGNNSSTWSTTSDKRIKKNITDNTTGLDKINQIQVRNFEYRTEDEITDLPKDQAIKKEGVQVGVIAQEIEQILPDVVREETTGVKSVNPDNLTWYMINAIKELTVRIKELEDK
tara:strand:- start:23 stop:724 length:702 start_codon:yes stop_codon:yes gene_type:complete